jgi:formylmethanofuran dehydrogenase subunit B
LAWIDGKAASLDEAAARAAQLLARSSQPLFAGMGADIDGVRATVSLAERLGGVIDHTHSDSLLRDLDCFREGGVMITTPNEARVRADVLLLVGDGLVESWPGLCERLLKIPARPDGVDVSRRLIWLASGANASIPGCDAIEIVAAGEGAMLAANLAALRARVKRRNIASSAAATASWDALASQLVSARFGVAIWSSRHLDALTIEMLNGLVRDLNETTRFSTLPLAPPDNGAGVLAACGWMTGYPMRTGFSLGSPAHDPWRFDAQRLARSGEADCALWISAFGAPPPVWCRELDFIALCGDAADFAHPPRVRICVGRPGIDHDGVLHSAETGTLTAVEAQKPGGTPSVAQALGRIAEQLGVTGAV